VRRLTGVAVLAALLGAGLAVLAVVAFDLGGGETRTIVQQAPFAGGEDASDGGGLTARDIYKRTAPGVVFIRADVVERVDSPFDPSLPEERRGQSTGTGFVIDDDGTILTNAHVVQGAQRVRVQFADKQVVDARILGRDDSTDLAVLKVEPGGLRLTPLPLGSSRGVQVGDPTVAIGNPFGLERTLTTGVISAVRRTITAPDGFQISNVIQTDAAINPGNSGGPLLDALGRVIGINSQIETGGGTSRGNVGIGFAVPIDTAKRIVPQLKDKGRVDRGYLGVEMVAIDGALKQLDLPVDHGALVQSVAPGGPAEKAGIRGGDITAQLDGAAIQLGGDIIVGIDGKKVRSDQDVETIVTTKRAGDEVELEVLRGGKSRKVEVKLTERPVQATP